MGLRGHQRPISLKELKRRKETHQAGDAGGSVAKLKEDADAEAPDKNKWGRDESSAAVETFNSDVRSLDKVTPLSGPKDKPALRYRQASSTRLVTRTDSIESSSGNPVVDLAADSQIHEDISTKGLQTEMPLTVQGRGISDPATEVAGKPGPRFLTVEDFLRREAEKKREEGVGDLDNNALVALKSIGTSSLAPNRDERPKRRSQRAVQSGPHWKILYKEEDVDESQEADPAEMEDAKEKALSLLNRRHISAAELRNKLAQNGFSANIIKVVADRMQEIGLQNDWEYAEAFARVRWQSFRWGPDRVRRELKAKGISTEDLDEAITAIYGDRADSLRVSPEAGSEDCEADQPDEEDVSANVERELYAAAKRHFLSGAGSDVNRRWKRTADWLARRGFSWGTASSIMVALKAEPDVWR